MHGAEGVAGRVAEEVGLGAVAHQIAELVVAAVHHALTDEAPLGNDDPLVGVVRTAVGEGVAVDDVLAEQELHSLQHGGLAGSAEQGSILLAEVVVEPGAARGGIVGQELDAVDARHGQHGVLLILQLGVLLLPHAALADSELAAQYLDEEIAIAAGRLQKARVEALGLGTYEVEHGIHLPLGREHLAMSGHALTRFDLFFRHSLTVYAKAVYSMKTKVGLGSTLLPSAGRGEVKKNADNNSSDVPGYLA